MPQNTPSPDDHNPITEEATSPAEDLDRAAEVLRVFEEVLQRGRDGASADWLKAAQSQVDEAWLRWRNSAGDASKLD